MTAFLGEVSAIPKARVPQSNRKIYFHLASQQKTSLQVITKTNF